MYLGGDVHLVELALHTHGEFLQRGSVGHDGKCQVALSVFALDGGRAPVLLDFGQFFKFYDFAGGGWYGELFDVGDCVAVFLAQTHHDVVFFTVLFQEAGNHAVDAVAYV